MALEEGVRLFPRYPLLACNVGLLHARAGEVVMADEILTHALPFAPEGSDVQTLLRRLLAAVRAAKVFATASSRTASTVPPPSRAR